MRVKLIKTMDFRRNEQTNYAEVEKEVTLGRSDVACLVSKSRNQILFVYKPTEVEYRGLKLDTSKVYRSVKLRLSNGSWDPLMLKDYADRAGLEITGLQGLREVLRARILERVTQIVKDQSKKEAA